ncbi:MAG: hypothetical protein WC307_06310 [Candidatus Nanoarchaeia archaeon]|jgi:hypothetical protein
MIEYTPNFIGITCYCAVHKVISVLCSCGKLPGVHKRCDCDAIVANEK